MKSRLVMVVFGMVMVLPIAACFPPGDPTPTEVATQATITYPSEGTEVEIEEMIRGTSQAIPPGNAIWVVNFPHEAKRYYPQAQAADVQTDGDWNSPASIGIDKSVGEKFDILVVTANEGAQDTFDQYLSDAEEKESWDGLEKLPDGAEEYDRVTVTRK